MQIFRILLNHLSDHISDFSICMTVPLNFVPAQKNKQILEKQKDDFCRRIINSK